MWAGWKSEFAYFKGFLRGVGGAKAVMQNPSKTIGDYLEEWGKRHGDRIARAQCRAGDDVDRLIGEAAAKPRRTAVGDEVNRDAAFGQDGGKRLGRKQMPARAAGRNEHRSAARHLVSVWHHTGLAASIMSPVSLARGRSRVSATSMPMP